MEIDYIKLQIEKLAKELAREKNKECIEKLEEYAKTSDKMLSELIKSFKASYESNVLFEDELKDELQKEQVSTKITEREEKLLNKLMADYPQICESLFRKYNINTLKDLNGQYFQEAYFEIKRIIDVYELQKPVR